MARVNLDFDAWQAQMDRDKKTPVAETITITIEPNVYDIDCLMSTAFDSGISYWASDWWVSKEPEADYQFTSDVIARDGEITVVEWAEDTEETTEHVLTLEKVLKGITLWMNHSGRSYSYLVENGDAEDGDCVVQMALFGEIVYG